MAASLDDLIDKVTEQSTALDSLNTFVEGLYQQIKDQKLSPEAQAKVDKVFEKVSANSGKIADAFTENSPPAQTPTENPTPTPVPPVNPI